MKQKAFASMVGALLVLESFAPTGLAAVPGDLSGTWRLNRELSDDPGEKLREARERGGGFRGGLGAGGRGRGGRAGRRSGGFGGRGDRPAGADEEGPRGLLNPDAAESLTIVHRDPELRITDGVGREHVLFTDGRKIEEERSSGGTTKIRARWKEGRIVVTTDPENGPKVTETYAATADCSRLTVTTLLEGRGGREIELRRVYDALK